MTHRTGFTCRLSSVRGRLWGGPAHAVGHPDLPGTNANKTITALEHLVQLADRELLSAEEVANLEQDVVDRNGELLARPAIDVDWCSPARLEARPDTFDTWRPTCSV